MELSVILPCRNEEQALPHCIKQIKQTFKKHKINGEIIVSDSSTDNSPKIAKKLGIRLIKHNKKGYGIACLEGFKAAKGDYIFWADPDASYDFNEIPRFLNNIKNHDLVIGNRFKGKISKDAMPWVHRYIGNPFLTLLINLFYKTKINDSHCGMRIIKKNKLKKLNLKTKGMEFASEIIIKAKNNNLKIKELSINYHKRKGESKLKPFIDGFRHFILILKEI